MGKVQAARHLLMVGAIGFAVVMPAIAAPAMAQAPLAQGEESRRYDLPPGSLTATLNRFAVISGLHVIYDAALTQNMQSAGLSGFLPRSMALDRLLAGSGLTYRFTGDNTVQLEKLPEGSGATVLPPVRIEGNSGAATAETAWGPVDGYVARRSATGTKTDTPLIETPQAVSVISRESMDSRNVQTVNEALRYTAGVKTGYDSDVRYDWTYIRGFESSIYGLYQNGLRWQAGQIAGRLDPYGVERIEVLKGASSVLYGLNTPAGIVNLVTKQPMDRNFGEVLFEGGSFDRYQGAFDVNTVTGQNGEWQFRNIGLLRDSDTQIKHVQDDRIYLAPALRWQANERTSLTILTNYQFDNTSGAQFLPANGTVLANPNGRFTRSQFFGDTGWDQFDRTQYSLGYQFEHELTDIWTLRQNARYGRIDTDWKQVYNFSLAANNRTVTRAMIDASIMTDVLAVDNQAQAKFETGAAVQHTALFGLDFSQTKVDNFQRGAFLTGDIFNLPEHTTLPTNLMMAADSAQTQKQTGAYLQEQAKILDHWVVTLGGRQDWVTEDTTNGASLTTTAGHLKHDDEAFTWRAGLTYLFDSGLAPYASYAESFQPNTGTTFTGLPLKPTEGRQYEAGIKFQPPGSNSSISAAVFDITQRNVQGNDPSHVGFSIQTGEVQSRGLEVEAVANLLPGFNLIGAYTYLDAEITKSTTLSEIGKDPSDIPHHAASLWGDYTFQRGDLKGFGFGSGVRYTGTTQAGDSNLFEMPAYTLVDAMLRYDYANWRFALNANNVFDKEYIAQCGSAITCFWGTGRTVVASVRYRW